MASATVGTVLPSVPPPPGPRARRRRSVGPLVARTILTVLLALLVAAGSFVGGLLSAPIDFALPPPPTSALLLASDGQSQFASLRPPLRREVVGAAQIPAVMRHAIIAAEDERFLSHRGIDPLATVRAAFRDLTGSSTQGGSTLTQQYVKNVYVGNERSALRKVKEAALAVRLERTLSKDQILTDYLNVLYLGNNVYGVQAAARYYYGVDVADLDLDRKRGRRDANLALARASMLAGIAPAPSTWNPVKDFSVARARQRYTLNQMIKIGYASSAEASNAFSRRSAVIPLQEPPPQLPTTAPEFADFLQADLKRTFAGDGEQALFQGGLRVRTTMDRDLQAAATSALHEVLPGDDLPEAAIAAIDLRTGDVRAMSTLRRDPRLKITAYERNGLNLATGAHRSTGSTIKPFTLAVALQRGHLLTETRDAPQCLAIPDPTVTPDGVYRPCNADVQETGTFTLRRALADSINTIYIPLAIEVGRARIRDLMLRAGVRVPAARNGAPTFDPSPNSFGLGTTAEVTPLSLANAYAALVDHGVHTEPRFFTDIRTAARRGRPGRVMPDIAPPVRAQQVLEPAIADAVTEAMGDVVASGTGVAAQQSFPVYGKTGTTDEARDAWFVGCVRDPLYVCISVWMGYEDHRSMHDLAGQSGLILGGTLPARIFARTLTDLRAIQAGQGGGDGGLAAPAPRG